MLNYPVVTLLFLFAVLPVTAAPAEFTGVETDPSTGFSRAVVVPPVALAHTAQFLPSNETGEIVGEGRADLQTTRVLDNLALALAEGKSSLDQTVKLNVYARDAETVVTVKRVLMERLQGPVKPAVTFVTGRLAHPDALVAMDAVAVTAAGSDQVTVLSSEKLLGAGAAHVAILPKGGHVYIAGQAEPGTLAEATRKTMESLSATLKFLGLDRTHVVSVKSFIQPISGVPEARAEIVKHFGGQAVPPLVFVEWTMANPIEIEMVVAAGNTAGVATDAIEFLTPPGMTPSPVYSRVARVNRGELIYVGGLNGPAGASGEAQVRDVFTQLKALLEKSGSDLRHLAKATYYVSDNDSSAMLNKIRPEFYDTNRPPAASKAMVAGVGLQGRGITVDMIAVQRPSFRAASPGGPRSPSEELASFRLADDELKVELVAAEPNVVSPVAIAWDAEGRMFVAEMMDYPLGPGTGQIRMLEDLDGDGVCEKATVFADKLPFPNGVLPWKGGLLVTAAPNIWYLKDTDGDGRADERRILFTGFGEGNQQLRVNGLTWGLDSWVYGANGRSDGEVRRPENPANTVTSIRRRDFRFRPDTGEFAAIAGFSQFGLGRDDWGNRFLSWNTIPIRHEVIEERYLTRNPYLPGAESLQNLLPPGDTGRVFPLTPAPLVFNSESSSHFNALAGLTIYRGQALGEKYRGNAFLGESLRNLIHRRVLEPTGVTFIARRGEEDKEFLASTDPWFHSVNFATGPDGALYVVDFYRQFVEHPLYVPESLRHTQPWTTGAEHGRIWRIKHKGGPASSPPGIAASNPDRSASRNPPPTNRDPKNVRPHMSHATPAELVKELGNENGWWRDTAQRLLAERQERAAIPFLKSEIRNPKPGMPWARLHALWTLRELGALDAKTLSTALRDKQPRIRESAVRLAESFFGGKARVPSIPDLSTTEKGKKPELSAVLASQERQLHKALPVLATDADPRVRLQLALTLGEIQMPDKSSVLVRLVEQGIEDPWQAAAILSSLADQSWPFLDALLRQHRSWLMVPTEAQAKFLDAAAKLVGSKNNLAELTNLFSLIKDGSAAGQIALLAGLADGLGQRSESWWRVAESISTIKPAYPVSPQQLLRGVVEQAERQEASDPTRVRAVRILAASPAALAREALLKLLLPGHPPEVQAAAARALVRLADPAPPFTLFARWSQYSGAARQAIITAAVQSGVVSAALLDAIEKGTVSAEEVNAANRQRLLGNPDPGLRQRAQHWYQRSVTPTRAAVVQSYQASLVLEGHRRHGAEIFAQTCLACHTVESQGGHVGPDLSGVASRPKETLLVDILDPSRQIVPDFINYRLLTRTGEEVTGLISAETATSVTLRRVGEPDTSVLRRDIAELHAESKSAMPDGLEQSLSVQDLADLLEFLARPERNLLPQNER